MSDLTTLASPFTAAQAKALLAIGLEDMPLYPAEVDPDEPDLTTPAGRHAWMASLDDWLAQAVDRSGQCFPDFDADPPTLAGMAADALHGEREAQWLL
jgi:hypothetical protein